jgi:ABC-type transport system involved in multi-copper enzyme maturation permease subunit
VSGHYDDNRIDTAAQFAGTIFEVFVSVQFILVTLLTPIYTASAIADEKERRTLEFLLATDLRNREIVLSKLLARFLNLVMLILAGLPILALLQFLGGVDPDLVLASYAATLATVASIAALGTLFSVVLRRGRDAILMTYLCIFGYFVGWGFHFAIPPEWLTSPSGTGSSTFQDVLDIYNAGNIIEAIRSIGYLDNMQGVDIDEALPTALRGYLLFHGILAVVCISWAVLRLRAIALKETYGRARRARLSVRWFGRPNVGARPMVWKEVHAEPGLRLHWFGRIIIVLLVLGSFVPAVYILDYASVGWGWWRDDLANVLGASMGLWGRITGAIVGTLLLIGVAVRAAGSITGERDKQTLDSLLTSPLDSNDILLGKWLGSVLSMRRGWIWLGAIYLLTFVCGGVNFVGLILVAAAWLLFASIVALIGLWASSISRSTMRATVLTLVTVVLGGGGHWLLWVCCIPCLWNTGDPRSLESVLQFQAFALTPPITLGQLAFRAEELEHSYGSWSPATNFGMAMIGLFIWCCVFCVLWGAVSKRLRAVTMRTGVMEHEEWVPPLRAPARKVSSDTHIVRAEEFREEK